MQETYNPFTVSLLLHNIKLCNDLMRLINKVEDWKQEHSSPVPFGLIKYLWLTAAMWVPRAALVALACFYSQNMIMTSRNPCVYKKEHQ